MTAAAEILAELRQRGVFVAVDGDTLCLKPGRALDDALIARVREAKAAILAALRDRPATCSSDCYSVEPGVWIHRPHTGCTTIIKPDAGQPLRQVQVTAGTAKARRDAPASLVGRWARVNASPVRGAGRCGGGSNEPGPFVLATLAKMSSRRAIGTETQCVHHYRAALGGTCCYEPC